MFDFDVAPTTFNELIPSKTWSTCSVTVVFNMVAIDKGTCESSG